ncbi:ATP-binding protein [Streptomyces sp. NPDC050560]|uniref:ATP-binding protein n=1 Tax=Streptomyces sp. NPDC050560 TaxID=3365630 RepID=UPI0037ABB778
MNETAEASVCAGAAHRTDRTHLLRMPAAASLVRTARGAVREVLAAWEVPSEVGDDAVLVVSELVTNVIAHTPSTEVECRLRARGDLVRVEVTDQVPGPTTPHRRAPTPGGVSGRGLALVGELSRAWGVRECPRGTGRTVWAELAAAREPATAAGAARPAASPRPPHGGHRRERRAT